MDFSQALATVSKAIAGAAVSAVVALAARFGFNADQPTVDALNVLVTAVLAALIGFVAVYLSPKNREKK